jgi:hypothetical protein
MDDRGHGTGADTTTHLIGKQEREHLLPFSIAVRYGLAAVSITDRITDQTHFSNHKKAVFLILQNNGAMRRHLA